MRGRALFGRLGKRNTGPRRLANPGAIRSNQRGSWLPLSSRGESTPAVRCLLDLVAGAGDPGPCPDQAAADGSPHQTALAAVAERLADLLVALDPPRPLL